MSGKKRPRYLTNLHVLEQLRDERVDSLSTLDRNIELLAREYRLRPSPLLHRDLARAVATSQRLHGAHQITYPKIDPPESQPQESR